MCDEHFLEDENVKGSEAELSKLYGAFYMDNCNASCKLNLTEKNGQEHSVFSVTKNYQKITQSPLYGFAEMVESLGFIR